jgi:hypothetical protein
VDSRRPQPIKLGIIFARPDIRPLDRIPLYFARCINRPVKSIRVSRAGKDHFGAFGPHGEVVACPILG